jgi:hypothetical protein
MLARSNEGQRCHSDNVDCSTIPLTIFHGSVLYDRRGLDTFHLLLIPVYKFLWRNNSTFSVLPTFVHSVTIHSPYYHTNHHDGNRNIYLCGHIRSRLVEQLQVHAQMSASWRTAEQTWQHLHKHLWFFSRDHDGFGSNCCHSTTIQQLNQLAVFKGYHALLSRKWALHMFAMYRLQITRPRALRLNQLDGYLLLNGTVLKIIGCKLANDWFACLQFPALIHIICIP